MCTSTIIGTEVADIADLNGKRALDTNFFAPHFGGGPETDADRRRTPREFNAVG